MSAGEGRVQRAVMTFATGGSRAFEIAGTIAVFVVLGWFLDARLGTAPVLTLTFFAFAVAGLAVRHYYAYNAEMDRAEEGKPWTSSRPS